MNNFAERRRTFPADVRTEFQADPFAMPENLVYMLHLKMHKIVVDEIFSENVFSHVGQMVSIRSPESDSFAPMAYCYDGYPMDEEHYLEFGCWRSTNPEYETRTPNCGCGM